jgi:hypothetical protein
LPVGYDPVAVTDHANDAVVVCVNDRSESSGMDEASAGWRFDYGGRRNDIHPEEHVIEHCHSAHRPRPPWFVVRGQQAPDPLSRSSPA